MSEREGKWDGGDWTLCYCLSYNSVMLVYDEWLYDDVHDMYMEREVVDGM